MMKKTKKGCVLWVRLLNGIVTLADTHTHIHTAKNTNVRAAAAAETDTHKRNGQKGVDRSPLCVVPRVQSSAMEK